MDRIVVRLVIRIGLIRVAPASTRAVCKSISCRYWFTVSTYRIPLFTTVPIRIRKPSRVVILIVTPVIFRKPKEPTRLNGIVVMTITENFTDSNWLAMTTNTRNTAMAIAEYREPNSYCIILSRLLVPSLIVPVRLGDITSLSIAAFVLPPV